MEELDSSMSRLLVHLCHEKAESVQQKKIGCSEVEVGHKMVDQGKKRS